MELAEGLAVSSMEVGAAADDARIRLSACQLGLFGHGEGKGRILWPADSVSKELRDDIEAQCADGKLPCAKAWAIAASRQVTRLEVAQACEALGAKISVCQLGAF
jgi:hypothetical protein